MITSRDTILTNKIRSLDELSDICEELRLQSKTIVHVHGNFQYLDIGRIKHLNLAKRQGDVLAVTVNSDHSIRNTSYQTFVPQRLRAESVAALESVDYIAISNSPSAVEAIYLLKPHIFVKCNLNDRDRLGHSPEKEAVESIGGEYLLTDEDRYSTAALISRYVSVFPQKTINYLNEFRKRFSAEDVIESLRAMRPLKVLTVGETIIDEYQFCQTMNKANKEPILVARFLQKEEYVGGILAIANHLANFSDNVALLSCLGGEDTKEEFIETALNKRVSSHFQLKSNSPTIVKRRFLEKYMAVKLFEVYNMRNERLSSQDEARFCERLKPLLPQYDVVIVADYGHGLIGEKVISLLCDRAKFLAVNTQTNAGNRGYNCISKYPRADYVSIDEPEARLECRNEKAHVRDVIKSIAEKMSCRRIMVTRGKHGCLLYDPKEGFAEAPALSIKLVDRIGAGDAVLAITTLAVVLNLSLEEIAFISSVVGAEACSIMGNKRAIDPESMAQHIIALLG